jgi:hypothetical protein
VLERLESGFVNTWTVIEELQSLKSDPSIDPEVRAFAERVHADYQYPVDSQLRAQDGSLLRQLAANDLMGSDMEARYLEFLR